MNILCFIIQHLASTGDSEWTEHYVYREYNIYYEEHSWEQNRSSMWPPEYYKYWGTNAHSCKVSHFKTSNTTINYIIF